MRKKSWTEAEYEREKAEYQRQMEMYSKQKELRDMKRQMRRWKPLTTTKLLMAYIFGNCTVIEIYAMIAMWHFGDLSALLYLIPAVITEGFSFAVYCAKAYNETKQEEIIKLERDKMDSKTIADTEPAREGAMG